MSVDAERSILGAILLDNDLFRELEKLTPAHFSLDSHRRIYLAMCNLAEYSRPIDQITLVEELDRKGELDTIGGPAYISGLLDRALPENINEHIRIVREASQRRKLIAYLESARRRAEDGEAVQVLAGDTNAVLLQLLQESRTTAIRCSADLPDVFTLAAAEIQYMIAALVPRGSVTLITGNPGCGKTWLAMRMAVSIASGSDLFGLVPKCESLWHMHGASPTQEPR